MDECRPKKSRRPVRISEEESVLCSSCGTPLILGDNWYRSSCGRGDYRCSACRKSYQAKYYKDNKERLREVNRKYYEENKEAISKRSGLYKIFKSYGLSEEEYTKLMEVNNCAICGATERLRVDHDHATGKVRGILCHHCNVGLGHFKDKIELLEKAKEYLRG
jgi:hypothetical protein